MGVYIDMEMPTTCEECNLESFCDKWIEARKICGANAIIRHPKCPLIPVIPAPLGRLIIDADAFEKQTSRQKKVTHEKDTL